MASFKIAQNPTFRVEVDIPRIGADPTKVGFEFKSLDRKALSKYYDKWNKARDEAIQESRKDGATWESATEVQIALEVRQLKEIVVGWDFEEDFTDEAIIELATSCAGAPAAVIDAYQKAYEIARRGN
jgi:hypothetical protein